MILAFFSGGQISPNVGDSIRGKMVLYGDLMGIRENNEAFSAQNYFKEQT